MSPAWKMHREVVLVLAWAPAILLQLAHPLVAQGVAEHSSFRMAPGEKWRRFRRTLDAMLTLTYGSEAAAKRVIDDINAIHDRVHGRLPRAAGVFPAGAVYSARDPRLLGWVHATLLDTFLRVYERYVGPLTPAERDRYCAEAGGTVTMLGVPAQDLPPSVAALEAYMAAMLASGEIAVTDTARALAREVMAPPLPRAAAPAAWVMRLAAIGLLPPAIREGYGFVWDPRRDAALRLSARVIRGLLPAVPPVIRYWPIARAATSVTSHS